MFPLECNIDKKDRTNRVVFGIVLLIGVLLGMGAFFYFLVGCILIAEGVVGWCGIPILVEKLQQKQKEDNNQKK